MNVLVLNTGSASLKFDERKLLEHGAYIRAHGVDPPEIADWKWR